MAIPLHILLPSAILAVLLVSLFIWWITGTRTKQLSQSVVTEFFDLYYPGRKTEFVILSETENMALVKLADETGVRLVRALGNKLVDQAFAEHQYKMVDGATLHFPRQGIAFSSVVFGLKTNDLENVMNMRRAHNEPA